MIKSILLYRFLLPKAANLAQTSEPYSVEDDVDVWRYAILELHSRNDDDDETSDLI